MISPASSSAKRLILLLSFLNIATAQDRESATVPPESDGEEGKAHPEDVLLTEDEVEELIEELLPEGVTIPPSLSPVDAEDHTLPPEVQDITSILGGDSSCSFCDTQDRFDPNLEFAGISCDQWALLSVFAPPGEECILLRAAAVKFCGCPTEVQETCQLCPHGYEGYDENQTIVFLHDFKCHNVKELIAVDGEETCRFLDQFSYMCGCPGVVPACSLCGPDEDGNHLEMIRPDEILIPGADTTCSDWDKILSLDPQADPLSLIAQGRDARTPCEKALLKSQENTGLQLPGLCGCPGVEPLNLCSPCVEGYNLQNDMEECSRLTFVTPYVTNGTKCDFLQQAAVTAGCCVPVIETFPPTSAPEQEEEASAAASFKTFLAAMVTGIAVILL